MLGEIRKLFEKPQGNGSSPDPQATLRITLAELRAAEGRLAERKADIERVQKLIRAADAAELELQACEEAAASAAKCWAASGARGSADEEPFTRAAQARDEAYPARLKADGAKAALDGVRDALTSAEGERDRAEGAVKGAVTQILIARAESDYVALFETRKGYIERLRRLAGLALMLHVRWGATTDYAKSAAPDSTVAMWIDELAIGAPLPDDALMAVADGWLAEARKVRAEADTNL